MATLRGLIAATLLAVAALGAPAWATSFSTDQSDVWWTQNEVGWGVQLVQRGNVIFATMYVYDQSTQPIFYTATLFNVVGAPGAGTWSGDLYLTSGPWFGTTPFNSTLVVYRNVGTMTWSASTIVTGTLTYTIDSVAVTKAMTRLTLVNDNYVGVFQGGMHEVTTGCADPTGNGTSDLPATITVRQSTSAISLSVKTDPGTCTFGGDYAQYGQLAGSTGNYSCTFGDAGTYTTSEMQVNRFGMTAQIATSSPITGCQISGWLGGILTPTSN
jgi:hypothetical protein